MDAPIRPVSIECQVDHHSWIVTLISMVMVASWIFGETRKEGLATDTVIIVGRRLYWGIFHAVALRVANMFCTRSWTW